MRTFIIFVAVAVVHCCVAADKPAVERRGVLLVLTTQMVERLRADIAAKKDYDHTLHTVRFEGHDYLVLDVNLGDGVAYKQIGIYAPEDDGTFRLCLFAESWAAGALEAALDQKTGILELRERANSRLKGEVVLTCNLKTIGTQGSTHTK